MMPGKYVAIGGNTMIMAMANISRSTTGKATRYTSPIVTSLGAKIEMQTGKKRGLDDFHPALSSMEEVLVKRFWFLVDTLSLAGVYVTNMSKVWIFYEDSLLIQASHFSS
jgi:hypothetical protein